MKCICILVLSFTTLFCDQSIVTFLMPSHCGTHWTMYSIEAMTGRFVSFLHRLTKAHLSHKTFW